MYLESGGFVSHSSVSLAFLGSGTLSVQFRVGQPGGQARQI